MAIWGRTIRSVFGKPIVNLSVELINIATAEIISLAESSASGYYRSFVPDGEYDLYVSNQKVNLFSPITIFSGAQAVGPAPGGGYGEGPYGDEPYGTG